MSRHLQLAICVLGLLLSACGTYRIERVAMPVDEPHVAVFPASSMYLWITYDGSGRLYMGEITLPDPDERWIVKAPGNRHECRFCRRPVIRLDGQGHVAGISVSGRDEWDSNRATLGETACRALATWLTDDSFAPGLFKVCPGPAPEIRIERIFAVPAAIPDVSRIRIEYRTPPDQPELVDQVAIHVPGLPASRLGAFKTDLTCEYVLPSETPCHVEHTRRHNFGVIVLDVKPCEKLRRIRTKVATPSSKDWQLWSSFPTQDDLARWTPRAEVDLVAADPPYLVVTSDRRSGPSVGPLNHLVVHELKANGQITQHPVAPSTTAPFPVAVQQSVFRLPAGAKSLFTAVAVPENRLGLRGPPVLTSYRQEPPTYVPLPEESRPRVTAFSIEKQILSFTVENPECLFYDDPTLSPPEPGWKLECEPNGDVQCRGPLPQVRSTITFDCNWQAKGCDLTPPDPSSEEARPCLEIEIETLVEGGR